MAYSPSAKAILNTLQGSSDVGDIISYDSILRILYHLPVTEALMPRVLREDSVWPSGSRNQFLQRMAGNPNYPRPSTGAGGWQFGPFVLQVEAIALEENAPWVDEWHIAYAIAKANDVWALGLRPEALLLELAKLSGRMEVAKEDAGKVWCFCDTNVFLHYRFFVEVEWPEVLTCESLVLVVPPAVIRELDDFRAERRREHLRRRARAVLPRLAAAAFAVPLGTPARVREKVEVLLLGREPVAFPEGLDPSLVDDRLVASALEFRWRRPGAIVTVLSGDLGVRLKALEWGLVQMEVPESLRLESEAEAGETGVA
ncbi:MAG: PIN domain-containing protein [Chloroflexota bacterium]